MLILFLYACSGENEGPVSPEVQRLGASEEMSSTEEAAEEHQLSPETRTLVIAGIEEAPTRFLDEAGEPAGIDVDLFHLIMEEMDIEDYEIIIESSSTRLERNWQNGLVYDMVFTYSYREEREEHLIFPEESHVTISWQFFALSSRRGEFRFDTYEDLQGLRIGLTEGFSYIDELWQAADEEVFTPDIVVSNNLQMEKLLNGRIDLLPYNTFAAWYEAQQGEFTDSIYALPRPIKDRPYYNTFVRASDYPGIEELPVQYDAALRRLKEQGVVQRILRRYGVR